MHLPAQGVTYLRMSLAAKFVLILITLFAPTLAARAQPITTGLSDSVQVELRTFDTEKYQDLIAQPQHQYDANVRRSGTSLAEYLWGKFEDLLAMIFGSETGWTLTGWLLLIGLICFAAFVIISGRREKFFTRPHNIHTTPGVEVLDIKEVDLDQLLQTALRDGDYRSATRYRYLRLLKKLSALDYIDWKRDKTNRQYVRELRAGHGNRLAGAFARITNLFDYCWYGGAPVEEKWHDLVAQEFEAFESRIDNFVPEEQDASV